MSELRRFPHPWRIVEEVDAFRVEDASGQMIAYSPFAASGQVDAPERLSRADAHQMAMQIAAIPGYKHSIHQTSVALEKLKRHHAHALRNMKLK